MPTRVFSNEDGNLNKTSIAVSRTRVDQDIDLSFAAKFIGTDDSGTNYLQMFLKKQVELL